MKEEFKKDKRKNEVKGMTSLGLVEISRRREKEPLEDYFLKDCKRCGTKYEDLSINSILDLIEKKIMNVSKNTVYKRVKIIFNSSIKPTIINNYMNIIKKIGLKYRVEIEIAESTDVKDFAVEIVK